MHPSMQCNELNSQTSSICHRLTYIAHILVRLRRQARRVGSYRRKGMPRGKERATGTRLLTQLTKTISVFSISFTASSLATRLPTIQSTSAKASPYSPRFVELWKAHEEYCSCGCDGRAAWTWEKGTYSKNGTCWCSSTKSRIKRLYLLERRTFNKSSILVC